MDNVLALDIGGTKIAAAIVNDAGKVNLRRQCPTPASQGAEAILSRIIHLAQDVLAYLPADTSALAREAFPRAVGVGTGGQVDPRDGHIIYATPLLPGWTGLPLKARLEAALGLPVAVDNDVNVTALGEATFGAGRGLRHLLCLAVGTGVGGAIVIEGEVYQGAAGAAGHFGHISIEALHGRRCNCGNIGCVEMYAAGPAIAAAWAESVSAAQTRAWLGKEPEQVTVEEISSLLGSGGEAALAAWQVLHCAGEYLGYAVTTLLHAFNPDAVVIGGGVAQAGEPFFAGIRKAVAERAMPSVRQTPILPAALGPDAALVGAAVLARRACTREGRH